MQWIEFQLATPESMDSYPAAIRAGSIIPSFKLPQSTKPLRKFYWYPVAPIFAFQFAERGDSLLNWNYPVLLTHVPFTLELRRYVRRKGTVQKRVVAGSMRCTRSA